MGIRRYSFGMKGEGVTGSLRCGCDHRSHRGETRAILISVSYTPKAFLESGIYLG